jgi:tryptophanyl-tRNA synthetase
MARKKRVLSGMRPTGKLHLGNLVGALENWVRLQDQYECYYFIADWHALTTDYDDTSDVVQNRIEVATDWLAAGLDAQRSTLFVQSEVPEHAELHLLLSMVTPLSWLERVPTYKEQIEQMKEKDLGTYGFLGYPLLQTADIVIYRADYVPVGEDQVVHVELARELVRRFNFHYGFSLKDELLAEENKALLRLETLMSILGGNASLVPPEGVSYSAEQRSTIAGLFRRNAQEVGVDNFLNWLQPKKARKLFSAKSILHEPEALLTQTPRLPGTDGRKMSKSYSNAIFIGEDESSVREKIRTMVTDPARVRRSDPGNPEVCPVFYGFHKIYSPPETIAQIDRDCRTAAIGCIDCKKIMADNLLRTLEPIRERRKSYEQRPGEVWDILMEGSRRARRVAKKTMAQVREAMKLAFHGEPAKKPSVAPGN